MISVCGAYLIHITVKKINTQRHNTKWETRISKNFDIEFKDDEIDFDRKSILEKEKRTNEKRKEILKWMKNKKDYLKSI